MSDLICHASVSFTAVDIFKRPDALYEHGSVLRSNNQPTPIAGAWESSSSERSGSRVMGPAASLVRTTR